MNFNYFKNTFFIPKLFKTKEFVSITNDKVGIGIKNFSIRWFNFGLYWVKTTGSVYELECLGVPEKFEDGYLNSLPNIVYDYNFIPYRFKKIYEPYNWIRLKNVGKWHSFPSHNKIK
jgi:hypothetical protein